MILLARYRPIYRIRYYKGWFFPVIKFKYTSLDDAMKRAEKLKEFHPIVVKCRSAYRKRAPKGVRTYNVEINRLEDIFNYLNSVGWSDDRPSQQRIIDRILEDFQSRMSDLGVLARNIKKRKGEEGELGYSNCLENVVTYKAFHYILLNDTFWC